MSKWLRLAVLVSAAMMISSMASASGLNLAWGNCPAEGGLQNKTFACASNTGSHILYASYIPDAGVVNASGNELVLDLLTEGPAFPDWWAFKNTGTCRQASLATSADFTAETGVNCVDYWAGQAAGGISAYFIGFNSTPLRARLIIVYAVAPALTGPLTAGTEYYSAKMTINSAKTVGTGSCAGCAQKVCIVLNSIRVTQPVGVGDQLITAEGTSRIATWQSEAASTCLPVPVHNRTWGSVKALYR